MTFLTLTFLRTFLRRRYQSKAVFKVPIIQTNNMINCPYYTNIDVFVKQTISLKGELQADYSRKIGRLTVTKWKITADERLNNLDVMQEQLVVSATVEQNGAKFK